MQHYSDDERGCYQHQEQARQLIRFDDFKLRGRSGRFNVTPTDIDGLFQLDLGNAYIFFELKYAGLMPKGQEDALIKIVDDLSKTANSCLFLAEHNQQTGDIYAKDAIVTGVYFNGEWRKGIKENKTLYWWCCWFQEFFEDKENNEKMDAEEKLLDAGYEGINI